MSTLIQRLYLSVYSNFKFKYVFNTISTYIVIVESTLNQQTRARWVVIDTKLQPNNNLCIFQIKQNRFTSNERTYIYIYKRNKPI